ncbi:nucleotidyltransferase family protein [Erythrobacter sp.]|uniref:nucleotidyltransferase family protein n=1 Tax=Erythrobacter sp. TaxID=1042 RepID=UPI003C77900B
MANAGEQQADRRRIPMSDYTTIDRFLAQSVRAVRADAAAPWFGGGDGADGSGDWRAEWGRIEYHGIATLLHRHAALLSNWPDALIERIAEEARLVALWEATHGKLVARLIRALADTGIASVVLKGTALAYWLHDDPATRRRGDTDLLVEPAQLDAARAVLVENGWSRRDDVHGINRQEGWIGPSVGGFEHVVDLHWAPVDSNVLRKLLAIEECFANARPLPRLDEAARRPEAAFAMVHAVVNQQWHQVHGYYAEEGRIAEARRLIWSVDFDLLTSAMDEADWQRLLSMCERGGVGPLVADALRAASRDLGTTLPEKHMAALSAQGRNAALADYFSNTDELSGFLLDLRNAPNLSDRARMLAMRAFPPRAHLRRKYRDREGWPVPLLRASHVIGGIARLLKRAVRT